MPAGTVGSSDDFYRRMSCGGTALRLSTLTPPPPRLVIFMPFHGGKGRRGNNSPYLMASTPWRGIQANDGAPASVPAHDLDGAQRHCVIGLQGRRRRLEQRSLFGHVIGSPGHEMRQVAAETAGRPIGTEPETGVSGVGPLLGELPAGRLGPPIQSSLLRAALEFWPAITWPSVSRDCVATINVTTGSAGALRHHRADRSRHYGGRRSSASRRRRCLGDPSRSRADPHRQPVPTRWQPQAHCLGRD